MLQRNILYLLLRKDVLHVVLEEMKDYFFSKAITSYKVNIKSCKIIQIDPIHDVMKCNFCTDYKNNDDHVTRFINIML